MKINGRLLCLIVLNGLVSGCFEYVSRFSCECWLSYKTRLLGISGIYSIPVVRVVILSELRDR